MKKTSAQGHLMYKILHCVKKQIERLLLHVSDMVHNAIWKFKLRAVDTDVVVLELGLYDNLDKKNNGYNRNRKRHTA